ncbi:FtsX-like permease family protein [Bacillus sp. 3103sda1]|uniref:FtsX-like permease family protein n=1 Tax=Bacillus sp. 3103sda1 TaxID=2953808 RepID=UPI00209E8151|nr:FtsX-like permease family protein [Bacillus sp. 3103sda1]MCP1123753.1 FtsX-like permease family protein [Bacillus sp. 3103sda1]
MTLFDIAKKNIKGNFKNYLVYFISLLLSVVIYYIFVSLQYSTEIADTIESSQSMRSIFMFASIILILFVTVFTLYSNHFFARKRKKEVGLYSLFGLPKKTIGKMLFYENLIIGATVLVIGILFGTLFSKLFTMILIKLLGTTVEVGMTFSLQALINTLIVFMVIILITSIQGYRLIFKFKLIELFKAEQKGEQEPKASKVSAIAAIFCLVVGYVFGFRDFSTNEDILTNLGIMVGGIIVGTVLLFSSLIIVLLKTAKKRKRSYYKGMNLISTSNLVYRIKGNARSLSVISLLSTAALCAFSVGVGMYYSFEKTVNLAAPFSYMHIVQDNLFDQTVDNIIREDEAHPVRKKMTIPILKTKGEASDSDILSERVMKADENPLKVISINEYNRVAKALRFPTLAPIDDDEVIAIRPMYTDYEFSDYKGETITIQLPKDNITLDFAGMAEERVINWSYPDVMIVVNDGTYQKIREQVSPTHYIGYVVEGQKTTKNTTDKLAAISTPESKLSSFYSEYRLGIEEAAFNVFILGFLGLVFVMATGSMIYFKQLTEATADKPRYDILKKIGVSGKDIGTVIVKQTAFIFGLPLVIGLAHYFVILNLLKRLFSNMTGTSLMLPILICVVVFILIYTVYYVLTVNSISRMVNGKSGSVVKLAVLVFVFCLLALVGIFISSESPTPSNEGYTGEKVQLNLPKPTGTYPVGTIEMHLTDEDRIDPWKTDRKRELMISIWYPAEREGKQKALYMQPGAAKHYDENILSTIGVDPGRIDLSGIDTNAWVDAPVASSDEGWPVIVYSPGGTVPRNFGTILVEELASRGYIVVTVDHTYEASAVEFPDGRVVTEKLPSSNKEVILKMLKVRVEDTRYVLDQLKLIHEGHDSDHQQLELPKGIREAMDLSRIGIFGHSAGGATAVEVMYEDNRVDAGIDMDGTIGYMPDDPLPVAQYGLDRPFMLMNSGYNDKDEVDSHLTAKSRKLLWKHSSGWKLDLSIPKGAHFTYTDYQFLLPQLRNKLGISPRIIQQSIGTADPDQMITAQRNYITAFFDLHLKGEPQPLLLSPSGDYPDVEFIK